jgi:hypothetical protein
MGFFPLRDRQRILALNIHPFPETRKASPYIISYVNTPLELQTDRIEELFPIEIEIDDQPRNRLRVQKRILDRQSDKEHELFTRFNTRKRA